MVTRKYFTEKLQLMPIPPPTPAPRQRLPSMEDIRNWPCKLEELCGRAKASRPDTCARLAQLAAKVNSFLARDFHRLNVLIQTSEAWRQTTALGNKSGIHLENLTAVGWYRRCIQRSAHWRPAPNGLPHWPPPIAPFGDRVAFKIGPPVLLERLSNGVYEGPSLPPARWRAVRTCFRAFTLLVSVWVGG